MPVGIRRSLLAGLVSLCGLVGVLLVSSAPALAAPPEAPAPVSVEGVTASEATLLGVLNPGKEGAAGTYELGTYEFLYAKSSTTCEGESKAPASPGISLGGGMEGVSQSVSGLEASTEYTVCLLARNGIKGETVVGPAGHFTTAAPPSPVETPEKTAATRVIATTATLSGELRPGGGEGTVEPGHYEFLYRASATECTGAAQKAAPVPAGVAAGNPQEQVSVKLTGLQPDTEYAFCLLARNEAGEVSLPSAPVMFTTASLSAPLIEETYATEVASSSAKLSAKIDPDGAETGYRFEYGTGAGYQPVPGSEGSIAEGATGVLVSVRMQEGLAPGSTYHYRVVASNTLGSAPRTDQTFTTETTGGEFALPDGRAYELVSPPQKDGAEVLGIGGGGVAPASGDATEASEDGTSVTYIANAPVGANPPGNTQSTQMFSTRSAGGWSSLDIATPHKHSAGEPRLNTGEEYQRFSTDLSHALLLPRYEAFEPPLAPEIHQEVGGETEIYLRNNVTNTFQAVVTSEPLPQVRFEGATPDLSHVVFSTAAGLDPEYPGVGGLFEWVGGHDKLVDVLPKGEPASGGSLASQEGVRHVISNDGTRVVWSGEGGLFTRDMATGSTVQVDVVQGGGGASGGGQFLAASSDGSRVFFTDGNDLVSGAHEGDLYMFEVPTEQQPKGHLTDLTLGVAGADLERVDVLEANEAGTSIYVRTPGELTSAPNSEGESATPCTETEQGIAGPIPRPCNLYLLRESPTGSGAWSVTFVAGGAEASPSEGHGGLGAAETLQRQAARVSPSGRYLAFMSRRSLTGYDNRDAISGEPDEEVYLYDAETNRVLCASCDPTGARPVGQYDTEELFSPGIPMDPPGAWEGRWVAAVIPGWTEDGAFRSTGHQPRYLDDSGRLFFTSSDALVPRDVNGRDDVYEYDPIGVGSCQPPSYGQGPGVVFNKTLGGCIGLISAGTGNTDSLFFDASASGNDVFFTTQDGLVQSDTDGTADMYDARVCTQAEPCPSSLAVSPACTTTDSCRVAPSPQPGVFGAPSSATFAGAGNATPTPSATKKVAKKKPVKCARGKKRSRSRCVKVKPKQRKSKAKRSAHTNRKAR